ncbi:hypothetical protein AKJ16_DCAP16688 [Drosera capensis]
MACPSPSPRVWICEGGVRFGGSQFLRHIRHRVVADEVMGMLEIRLMWAPYVKNIPLWHLTILIIMLHFSPLFFSHLSLEDADDFCKKVDVCGEHKLSSLLVKEDKCDLCHYVIDEVKIKLKDPDAKI